MSNIRSEIRGFIVDELQGGHDPSFLDNDTHLIEDGLIDSLGIMAMVAFIEAHWKVEIDAEEVLIQNFETIPAIERLVMGKLG